MVRRPLPSGEERCNQSMADVLADLARPAPDTTLKGRPVSHWQLALRSLRRDRLALACGALLALVVLIVIAAALVAPHDPYAQRPELRNVPPGTSGYLLGGDELGRDILSRLIWGGQNSLKVAVLPVLLSVLLGGLLGIVSAYYGGWVDSLIMRALDVLLAFPSVLLALAIAAALGPGMENAVLAIVVVAVPVLARIVRSAVLSVREREFVLAARASGSDDLRIMLRQILPNILSPIIVYATLETGRVIILASGLSFLGLGIKPPEPDWGVMLASGREYIRTAPHGATIPGLVIFVVTLAFNVLGDGLRDALDPRLRTA
jgi:peptide/nickel transport system permease protein